MKPYKVLVVTSKDDAHADYVISKANSLGLGERLVRLNTEDFLENAEVTFREKRFSIKLRDSRRFLDSAEIFSVWYRRPKEVNYGHLDPRGAEFAKSQAEACLRGLYFCTHDDARWVNPLPNLHRARIKLQQIYVAREVGLQVPRTIVSNVPEEIIRFHAEVRTVCTKSLDEPSFNIGGRPHPFFTRLVSLQELTENSQALRLCPTLFQEYIEKKSDIRVIVIGATLSAFEICSQSNDLSIIDFRGIAPRFLRHTAHELPMSIQKQIREFVQLQGLSFSALDFALSQNGDYFFLENNPNGQWLWLEQLTGVRLSDFMIEHLFDPASASGDHSHA